jgi:hypothetical protein
MPGRREASSTLRVKQTSGSSGHSGNPYSLGARSFILGAGGNWFLHSFSLRQFRATVLAQRKGAAMDINSMGRSPVVTAYAAAVITPAGPVRSDTQPKTGTVQRQAPSQQRSDTVSLSAEALRLSTMSKTVDSAGDSQSGKQKGGTGGRPRNPLPSQAPQGKGSFSVFA